MLNKTLNELEKRCGLFFASLWPGEEKALVFGRGKDKNPVLMLVGEAPGEKEVLAGEPFVGRAGQNLTAFLQGVDLKREDIYITNTVKIRPTRVTPKRRVANRPPSKEEIGLFLPYLMEEIAAVKPKLLVTLGNVALKALVSGDCTVGACHGQFFEAKIAPPDKKPFALPLFALYHPASVIYNRSLFETYQSDLEALKRHIHSI